jgi:hypothetical protein
MQKQKTNEMWEYRYSYGSGQLTADDKKNYFDIQGVPPSVAKSLMTGDPNVDPNDTQNNSPTMAEMVELAEKYNGTLFGYVIPVESGRDDARITFDGVVLPVEEVVGLRLGRDLGADEADLTKDGQFRLWWD